VLCKHEVAGSTPAISTKIKRTYLVNKRDLFFRLTGPLCGVIIASISLALFSRGYKVQSLLFLVISVLIIFIVWWRNRKLIK
jgi:hypothetical protein